MELGAGEMFRDLGMDLVADDEPLPEHVMAAYISAQRAFVVADETDRAVGYALVAVVDGAAHVEQVSVDPADGRRGVGRSLLRFVEEWAKRRGLPRITLTTFADVPWNRAYYERCGYSCIAPADVTPGLAALRHHEAEHGLDRWPRVCTERDLHRET